MCPRLLERPWLALERLQFPRRVAAVFCKVQWAPETEDLCAGTIATGTQELLIVFCVQIPVYILLPRHIARSSDGPFQTGPQRPPFGPALRELLLIKTIFGSSAKRALYWICPALVLGIVFGQTWPECIGETSTNSSYSSS